MTHQLIVIIFGILISLILSKSPPNIIFILVDDLGYDDIQFQAYPPQIHTPNIDKLRSESQFLSWYYGLPCCTPTRTSIMTGLYSLHNGINTVLSPPDTYGVPLKFKFISQQLYDNGYETRIVGKWHMGFYKEEYTPTFRGFQSFFGYYNGMEDYYSHLRENVYDLHIQNEVNCSYSNNCSQCASKYKGQYSTFIFVERAIDIIKNHSISNTTKPLFLYLPFQAVHVPDQVPNKYILQYNNSIANKQRKTYAGMLSCLDEGIGNITDALMNYGYMNDNNGNTLIIVSSDNGGYSSDNGAYNWPLRGGKFGVWEGGTRLSAFIYGTKDLIDERVRGKNYTQLISVSDWYPTLLNAAGIDENRWNISYNLDGINQWNGISGKDLNISNDKYFEYRNNLWYGYQTNDNKRTTTQFTNFNGTAFRYNWMKLINGSGGTPSNWGYPPSQMNQLYNSNGNISSVMLFNLSDDPTEHYNIASNNSDIVNQLYEMMTNLEPTVFPQVQPDKSCPAIHYANNSAVGSYYIPWC